MSGRSSKSGGKRANVATKGGNTINKNVLPSLQGSQKQVAWAEDIRKNYIAEFNNYFISDDKFMKNEIRPETAIVKARQVYENGITSHDTSMQKSIYDEAESKGLTGRNADDYEVNNSPYLKSSNKRRGITDKSDKLKFDKAELKKYIEYSLKKETSASAWITAFKNTRYDTFYNKGN